MFWQSVLNGLGVLLNWQTYVAALMYLIISFLPLIGLILVGSRTDGLMERCGWVLILVRPFFQVLAVFVTVCTLFPIMVGGKGAAWSLPWIIMVTEPGKTLIIIAIMLVLSFIGALVPILGHAKSFIMFIMGGTVLVFLTLIIHKANPELGIRNIELIPGWLTIIGIVIVSGLSSLLGILTVAAFGTLLFKDREDITLLISMPVGSAFGLIPVFIYGAWIGLQIKALN